MNYNLLLLHDARTREAAAAAAAAAKLCLDCYDNSRDPKIYNDIQSRR